jgi:hypothetical protein
MENEEQPMKQPIRTRDSGGRTRDSGERTRGRGGFAALLTALALGGSFSVHAQEGYPLDGSWSGERQVEGKSSRVLLVMSLQRDQSVKGFLLENGKRQPLQNVQLHPENWTVNFSLDGGYQVEGKIENLGSVSARKIVGKWSQGSNGGSFAVNIN